MAQTNDVSRLILAVVYDRYPSPVSVKDLAERLNKSQRFIHSQISNMVERNTLTNLDRVRNSTKVQGFVYELISRILEEQKGLKLVLKALEINQP